MIFGIDSILFHRAWLHFKFNETLIQQNDHNFCFKSKLQQKSQRHLQPTLVLNP